MRSPRNTDPMKRRQTVFLATMMATMASALALPVLGQSSQSVSIRSDGWELKGELILPSGAHSETTVPGVLLLNQAGGDRSAHAPLARALEERGIASMRVDLRGHGESTNLGTFDPAEPGRNPLIWDAERDVQAVLEWMEKQDSLDPGRLAVVGASYSAEEMAEAGILNGFARAYVALSPGSFSEASAAAVDSSAASWLFVMSRDEPPRTWVTPVLDSLSRSAEVWLMPGSRHATNLIQHHPSLAGRLADWLVDLMHDSR